MIQVSKGAGRGIAVGMAVILSWASGALGEGVDLNIADRPWDPARPVQGVGWCGEASIQMAAAYYGRELSQQTIHMAGRPEHPDLYQDDIDTALDRLGFVYERWDQENQDVLQFIAWIKNQLTQGRPVLSGIKIYPDAHPEWILDHFVLVVGYKNDGLLLNTQLDMDGQVLIPDSQLAAMVPAGYAFENAHKRYFARSIIGPGRRQ